MPVPFTIDAWSDAVCPWCWLGKRRLEAALARRPGLVSAVRWRPFELNPGLPPEGVDHVAHLAAKFGDPARLRAAQQQLAALGREAGLDYRFEAIRRSPNTRAVHALVALAGERQDAVVEAAFRAYFHEGRDLGDLDELAAIATAAGLDGAAIRERLASRVDFAAVEREEREGQGLGISGVPFFVLAGRWAVSGAQDEETWVRALDHVAAELGGPLAADGPACATPDCAAP